MKWKLLSVAVLSALTAGCHSGAQTDLMERELRHQEDRIYELEDCVQRYEGMLDSAHQENMALKRRFGVNDRAEVLPDSARRDGDEEEYSDTLTPQIELGEEIDPNSEGKPIEPNTQGGPGSQGEPELPDSSLNAPIQLAPQLVGPAVGKVERIELNKLLSGPLDADGRPGDEGVLVVVEPRDGAGRLVHAVGQLSVMLRDPQQSGRQAQLGRWDFQPEDLSDHWRKSMLAEGYVFELPWPTEPPRGKQLQLWARLVDDNGQKHLAQLDINTRPHEPTQPSIGQFRRPNGWMRRDVPAGAVMPAAQPMPRSYGEPGRFPYGTHEPLKSAVPVREQPILVPEPDESDQTSQPTRRSAPSTGKAEENEPPESAERQRPEWQPYR